MTAKRTLMSQIREEYLQGGWTSIPLAYLFVGVLSFSVVPIAIMSDKSWEQGLKVWFIATLFLGTIWSVLHLASTHAARAVVLRRQRRAAEDQLARDQWQQAKQFGAEAAGIISELAERDRQQAAGNPARNAGK